MKESIVEYLMTLVLDHLLDPVDQVEVIVLVDVSYVSGVHPFLAVLIVPKRFGRSLGVVQVTTHRGGAVDEDFTSLSEEWQVRESVNNFSSRLRIYC